MWLWILPSLSWLVALLGVVDIISAIYPPQLDRYIILREFVPLDILHLSRTLTLIFGIGLLSLASGLAKRKHRAWVMSLSLLLITLVLHIIKGLDIEEFIITTVAAGLLIYFRPFFYVESDKMGFLIILKKFFLTFSLLFIYTIIGFTLLKNQYSVLPSFNLIRQDYLYNSFGIGTDRLISHSHWARWFESSVGVVSVAAISLMLFALFSPSFEKDKPTEDDHERLKEILRSEGGGDTGYYSLMSDKQLWFDDNSSHAVAYKTIGSHCVVLGGPIGEGDGGGTSWQFQELMRSKGYKVIWYNMQGSELAQILHTRAIKIGEAAIIPLKIFSLSGPTIADVRHAVTHMEREHAIYDWYEMNNLQWIDLKDIDALYSTWASAKKSLVLTFSLDFYPFPEIKEGLVLVVRSETGILWAVFTFFPAGPNSYILDLMMRAPGSPSGVVESAIVNAIEHFRSLGIETLNLGTAPLADVTQSQEVPIVKTIRNALFDKFNHFYGYKSLYKFKSKFNPSWSPRYVYVPDYLGLPAYMGTILAVHLKKNKNI